MTDPIITRNDDVTVTIEGEIPEADFAKHKNAAITALGNHVDVAGFRKGHVPEDILVKHVGEHALLREMAERALAEHYGNLLIEHAIDAIGHPEVTITKLAFGNPLGFRITTAVLPTVALPDYKALAARALKDTASGEPTVADEEVGTFIQNLLADRKKADEHAPTELTDDVARSFGDFTSADEMRTRIREGMLLDKKRTRREERRMAIIDALLADTGITMPEIVIEAETDKLMAQFANDLSRMGLSPTDYFAKVGKDETTMRAELRPDAEKRAKIQLLLNEIAVAEKLTPSTEEVQKEVDHLLSHHEPHEGHDEERERESARIYVTTILTNEKVLAFLENQT